MLSFYIDLRKGNENAEIGNSNACDATFIISDDDFYKLCMGELNP